MTDMSQRIQMEGNTFFQIGVETLPEEGKSYVIQKSDKAKAAVKLVEGTGGGGEPGPQGPQGPAGEAATITVGDVTTLNAGEQATVTNAGTTSAAVFNFGIPKGEKGDKGDQGEQGPQGDQGPQGPAGADGQDGAQGAQGPAGTNATITGATATVDNTTSDAPTCTVQLGGTESARTFAFNFVGIKGAKGDAGAQGPAGADGAAGAKGDQGEQGPAGAAATIDSISVTVDNTTSSSPTCQVTPGGTAQNRTFTFAFTGIKGAQGEQGEQGPAGSAGAAGQGVPTGGTAGQILAKVDGTNYNTQWIAAPTEPAANQLMNGTAPTVADIDSGAVTDVATLITSLNAILAQLRTRGVIA